MAFSKISRTRSANRFTGYSGFVVLASDWPVRTALPKTGLTEASYIRPDNVFLWFPLSASGRELGVATTPMQNLLPKTPKGLFALRVYASSYFSSSARSFLTELR